MWILFIKVTADIYLIAKVLIHSIEVDSENRVIIMFINHIVAYNYSTPQERKQWICQGNPMLFAFCRSVDTFILQHKPY